MANPLVSLLMGSDSDLPTVKEACTVLQGFDVPIEVRVLSAHRCPEDLAAYVKQAYAIARANPRAPNDPCGTTPRCRRPSSTAPPCSSGSRS